MRSKSFRFYVAAVFCAATIFTLSPAGALGDQFTYTKPEICSRSGTPFEATIVSIDWRGSDFNELRQGLESKLRSECTTSNNAYQIADHLLSYCNQICPTSTKSQSCGMVCSVYDALNHAYLNGAVSAKKRVEPIQKELSQCRSTLDASKERVIHLTAGVNDTPEARAKEVQNIVQYINAKEGKGSVAAEAK